MLLPERAREMGVVIVTDVVAPAGAQTDEAAVSIARNRRELMRLGEMRAGETPNELGERDTSGAGAGFQGPVLVRLEVDHGLALHSMMIS